MTRARDVADTQENLGGGVPPFVAGKNKIINGDFGVWQRGTTIAGISPGQYSADRFKDERDGTTGAVTATQQTFTPGTAPVAGYEGTYFLRHSLTSVGNSTYIQITQYVEDVRIFAGQTATFSFWAKADSARTSIVFLGQNFGSGGSATNFISTPSITYSTSWQRFSFTFSVPSVAGKTIGVNSALMASIRSTATTGSVLDIWGVQLEVGSVATPFTTATGTVQGELAACQRYFYAVTADGVNNGAAPVTQFGTATSTGAAQFTVPLPVTMRTAPSFSASSQTGFRVYDAVNAAPTITSIALATVASQPNSVLVSVAASTLVTYRPYYLIPGASATNYLYMSAEL